MRLRQAVNYAIDRRALARLGDAFQPLPEQPDRPLPAAGNARLPRRTRLPDHTRPRQSARALAARRSGRTAVLYTCNASPCPEQAQIVKNDLAAIGLHVQVKSVSVREAVRARGTAR